MSSGINKAIILGNICADPEVRYTANGQAVANMRVAIDDVWVDKQGQKQKKTEYITCTIWGKQAEHCGEYLSKGSQVFIEGKFQTKEFEGKDGQKKHMFEVVANHVTFLGGAPGRGGGKRGEKAADEGPSGGGPPDDDIAF